MPSETLRQHGFMGLCARSPEKAHGKCPPRSVAEEFLQADRGKSFGRTKAKKQAAALRSKE